MTDVKNLITSAMDGVNVDNAGAIIDHIDVWTSAIKKRNSQGRGSNSKTELTGVKKLRELILELAVRGKLVPQDPNDEPASVLLEKIAAEKTQLIANKKIKKQKSLPEITDEEKPFVLPTGWTFERLGNYSTVFSGSSFKSGDFNSVSGVKVIKITNAGVGKLVETDEFLPNHFLEKYQSFQVYKNDMVLALTRPYISDGLKISLCPNSYHKSLLNQRVAAIRAFQYPEYLFLTLRSPYILNLYKRRFGGNGLQPNLKMSDVTELVIALAPLAEQHRIVAKVDELMALCDQLEKQTEQSLTAHQALVEELLNTLTQSVNANSFQESWQRIADHFDMLFTTEASIDQLKQTILQLAVMGKLVPQNPSDEPASKLLEKIAEEKAQLIKDKKIKKQKPLPVITNEEKMFELPVGWASCRLAELIPQFQNGASSRGDNDGKDTIVLRLADIKKWEVSLADTRSIVINEKSIERYGLEKGDVLIIRVNGSADIVGRFITCRQNMDAIYCDHFIRMRFPIKCFSSSYLSLLGSSSLIRERISDLFVSTAGQKTVNQTHIGSLTVTLPPLAEQHRIVAKVDELMALCDQLKTRLADAQTTQLHLADAVVENALS